MRLLKHIRRFASHSDKSVVEQVKIDKMHKEEYLSVARDWPHEYYDPHRYDVASNPADKKKPIVPEPDVARMSPLSKTFVVGVFLVAGYQANKYLTQDMEKHPFTQFIDSYQKHFDGSKVYEANAVSFPLKQQIADDTLILRSRRKEKKTIMRTPFPDSFYRASDFIIPVGSQIDLSDLKIKHTWQENDDIFGVPYPDNK